MEVRRGCNTFDNNGVQNWPQNEYNIETNLYKFGRKVSNIENDVIQNWQKSVQHRKRSFTNLAVKCITPKTMLYKIAKNCITSETMEYRVGSKSV